MTSSPPILSVVIPTRNRREMAAKALASVLTPLPFPCEIILSDNASTDGTPSLAQQFPDSRYLRRPSLLPMAEHWNLCVAEAQGKYVKLLCDDDWLLPGALTREVTALEAAPDLAAVASARFEVNAAGTEIVALRSFSGLAKTLQGEEIFLQMLVRENILGPPTSVTFRKALFRGFPPYQYAADWAAWLRLAESGAFAFLPEPGANFRLHPENLTLRHVQTDTDFLEVQALRRECLRRLSGGRYFVGAFCWAWIWAYRFGRRVCRHLTRGQPQALPAFFWKALTYRPPPLG